MSWVEVKLLLLRLRSVEQQTLKSSAIPCLARRLVCQMGFLSAHSSLSFVSPLCSAPQREFVLCTFEDVFHDYFHSKPINVLMGAGEE